MSRLLPVLLAALAASCALEPDDGELELSDEDVAVLATSLTVSGPNGSLLISGMSGHNLTVTYSPGRSSTWARLYLSEGNGAGLVLAAQNMSYAAGSYTHSFAHPTFQPGAVIHVLVLRNDSGVETPVPKGVLASSTSWAQFEYAGSGGGDPGPGPGPGPGNGTFPIVFTNDTSGAWSPSQIHVQIIGVNAAGQWCTVKPNGDVVPMSPADNDAPGHLTKRGVNYAGYGASLAQAGTWTMPPYLVGGRIYISVGSPVYIRAYANGWAGPNVEDPGDPNEDVYYDWIEFTYAHNQIPLGVNTTQVDQFGLPLTLRVVQTSSGYDSTVGINRSRADVYAQFNRDVSAPFKHLARTHRILAPFHGDFRPGKSQADYLKSMIDDAWSHYASNQLVWTLGAETYRGTVINNRLQLTRNGAGPFFVDKPTTHDVMAAAGAMARGNTVELAFEAQLDAAFNRGVIREPGNWHNAAAYFARSPRNDYVWFFHRISLHGRAYGFPYDDVNDQSTVRILSNANPATSLTIGVRW